MKSQYQKNKKSSYLISSEMKKRKSERRVGRVATKYKTQNEFRVFEKHFTTEEFKEMLDNSGWKMQKIADIAGVTVDTVYQWRFGVRNPRKKHLIKILIFLNEGGKVEEIKRQEQNN